MLFRSSILVETGFITNPEEEKFLNSENGQEQVAENVYNAIKRYKTALESTGNGKALSAPINTNKTSVR